MKYIIKLSFNIHTTINFTVCSVTLNSPHNNSPYALKGGKPPQGLEYGDTEMSYQIITPMKRKVLRKVSGTSAKGRQWYLIILAAKIEGDVIYKEENLWVDESFFEIIEEGKEYVLKS